MGDSVGDFLTETEAERTTRHTRRLTFGSVAELYEATRQRYPVELVDRMVSTAGVGAGDRVLEIGCGTGQLTRQLLGYRFALTAIDISPEMVAIASTHQGMEQVAFAATAFEDFDAADGTYGLIASATAFHWVDPDIGLAKVARLLRPGGWMAWLGVGESYDPPLGAAVRDLYIARSDDGGAWTRRTPPTEAEVMNSTGLFTDAQISTYSERRNLPTEVVLGVELTRATTLSYDEATRQSFRDELLELLGGSAEVSVELRSRLAIAQVR